MMLTTLLVGTTSVWKLTVHVCLTITWNPVLSIQKTCIITFQKPTYKCANFWQGWFGSQVIEMTGVNKYKLQTLKNLQTSKWKYNLKNTSNVTNQKVSSQTTRIACLTCVTNISAKVKFHQCPTNTNNLQIFTEEKRCTPTQEEK